MSQVIYKYPVAPGTMTIFLPKGAKVLTTQAQSYGQAYLWALVDPEDTQLQRRQFIALPTGVETDIENLNYINTFQLAGGNLIFHLFEAIG